MQKSNRLRLLMSALTALIVTAAVGIYVWVYMFNPCEEDAVKQASAFLSIQLRAHDDLYQFTTTVYQDGINPPVSKMQQIFMDTQTAAVPVCMQKAKTELLNYMRTVIRAFRAFEAGASDITIRDLVSQSNTHYDNFNSELEAVNKCAPFCLP